MTREELVAYVAEHANEYVQHYVEALCDEYDELSGQLAVTRRRGFSDKGRVALYRVGRVVVVIVVAYLMGRFSN